MPDTNSPASKYTLKEWVRHPTTIMLIIAVNAIWLTVFIIVRMADDKSDIWQEQAEYFRSQWERSEKEKTEYITTVLFKNGQIKNRDEVIEGQDKEIDSLKAVILELTQQ